MRVVDGDTIRVRLGGREERVRYIGVDTPETVKPGTPVQCFGQARERVQRATVVRAGTVRLVFDAERRDRYGRLLAYVYREPDGLFVNAELVRRGYAQPLTIPPNVAHAAEFRRARAAGPDARPRALGRLRGVIMSAPCGCVRAWPRSRPPSSRRSRRIASAASACRRAPSGASAQRHIERAQQAGLAALRGGAADADRHRDRGDAR